MSIKVAALTKLYDEQKAIDEISFEIGTGEVVGFLGPNGAGKSTTMKILSGYLPATSGNAWVAGYHVVSQNMQVRKSIGYLPEHNPLYTDMYIKEYLMFLAKIHEIKKPASRIDEMIELTGLQIEQKKKIGNLSKGYRQRVGLAAAIIHNPPVLILDEPTTGLDPNQIIEIRNLIKHIGTQKTVLLSTHIMQEVEAMCSRVIIINKGKIVANDEIKNLQKAENTTRVFKVELDKNPNLSTLLGLPTITHAVLDGTNQILVSSLVDCRAIIFEWAVNQKYTILSMQESNHTLEEIFRGLTNNN
jgi:ABC-2 type transport system ATP-binding protein